MLKRKIASVIAVLAIVLGADRFAVAGTTTGSLVSSATLTSDCSVSPTPLLFGSMSGLLANPVSAGTLIMVKCTQGTAYTLQTNLGLNTLSTSSLRLLQNTTSSDQLSWGLYLDSAHTVVFGPSNNGYSGTGTGVTQPIPVYGLIPAGQGVAPGSYTDTLQLTVSY